MWIFLLHHLALAGTAPPASLNTQNELSPAVVEAEVSGFTADTVFLDGETLPITWVNLAEVSLVAGMTSKVALRLKLPGGELENGLKVSYPSTPKFSVGDRVLLVALEDSPGELRLTSFSNSVFYKHVANGLAFAADQTKRPIMNVSCADEAIRYRDDSSQTNVTSGSFSPADWNDLAVRWADFVSEVASCFGERQ